MSQPANKSPKAKISNGALGQKKASTSDVPMVGLRDVLEFIKVIHVNGLERAPMPKVAEGTGYGNATSTPFYRRLTASRHFGLVSSRGADLTIAGQDCVKPMADDATHQALLTAVQSIPSYMELVQLYDKKRINIKILANWFERKFEVNEAAASACAKAFVESMREAGALSADEILNFAAPASPTIPRNTATEVEELKAAAATGKGTELQEDGHRFELILDLATRRRFVIYSPASVTRLELKRIQDWLSFQLCVVDQDPSTQEQ